MRLSLFGRTRNRLHPVTAAYLIAALNRARYDEGFFICPDLSGFARTMAWPHFGGAVPPRIPTPARLAKIVPWEPSGRYLS